VSGSVRGSKKKHFFYRPPSALFSLLPFPFYLRVFGDGACIFASIMIFLIFHSDKEIRGIQLQGGEPGRPGDLLMR